MWVDAPAPKGKLIARVDTALRICNTYNARSQIAGRALDEVSNRGVEKPSERRVLKEVLFMLIEQKIAAFGATSGIGSTGESKRAAYSDLASRTAVLKTVRLLISTAYFRLIGPGILS